MDIKYSLVLGLCLVAVGCLGERVRYDNYHLYALTPSNAAELKVLKNFEAASESILFLTGIHKINEAVKVVVAPQEVYDFLEIMQSNEIEYELMESNLQRILDNAQETVGEFNPLARAVSYNWNQYYKLEGTYAWLQQLAIENPGVVTLIEAGKSFEKRSILGVKISKSRSEKPGVFIEAGIHAREWIGSAVATYMINQLLNSDVPSVKQVAENYNWYILPHANPDGYVYTHTSNRMWRKTRTPYGRCYGADPNRNWGIKWNVIGSSNSPCSDTYAGPKAFSEIETRSLAQYLKTLKGKISLYISLHSYSQLLLFPYGYTANLPANYKDLQQVFNVSIAALNKSYGTKYTGGNIYDAIYPASGSSTDWAYDSIETKMSFCYELRPDASKQFVGFLLPASQIAPTGEEIRDSIVAMVNEVQRLGYFNQIGNNIKEI